MADLHDGRLLVNDWSNHSPWLWVVSIIGLVLVVCFALYRISQRFQHWVVDSYDDHIALLSLVAKVHCFNKTTDILTVLNRFWRSLTSLPSSPPLDLD